MFAIVIKILLSLPLLFFVIAALGFVLRLRHKRVGQALLWSAPALLWILSTPWVAATILASLQTAPSLDLEQLEAGPAAIVVLGADLTPYSPELRGTDVGPLTLVRLRYGARLARATGLPLLVAGGQLVRDTPPLADVMAQVLEDEFGQQSVWRETRSKSTFENAQGCAKILRQRGIEEIYLVTHAWHIPRAQEVFERQGLVVTAAPTAFQLWPTRALRGWVPSSRSLRSSSYGLHEWVGRLYYALRE